MDDDLLLNNDTNSDIGTNNSDSLGSNSISENESDIDLKQDGASVEQNDSIDYSSVLDKNIIREERRSLVRYDRRIGIISLIWGISYEFFLIFLSGSMSNGDLGDLLTGFLVGIWAMPIFWIWLIILWAFAVATCSKQQNSFCNLTFPILGVFIPFAMILLGAIDISCAIRFVHRFDQTEKEQKKEARIHAVIIIILSIIGVVYELRNFNLW